jgi:hypothetical protein
MIKIPHTDFDQILEENWESIDQRVSKTLVELEELAPGESALDRVNPVTDMYGCGAWGCAYPTLAERWAVKVTADPSEGIINSLVLDDVGLRTHPGIAYVLGLWRLPDQVLKRTPDGEEYALDVFVILREDIQPAVLIDGWVGQPTSPVNLLHNIRLDAGRLNDIAALLTKLRSTPYSPQNEVMIDEYEDEQRYTREEWATVMVQADDKPHTRLVADFMREFNRDNAAYLADVHAGNVGTREHDLSDFGLTSHVPSPAWVAFDLGHSSGLPGSVVPLISNPGRVPRL